MVDNDYLAADVGVDPQLAFDLVPYLQGFDRKWILVKSQEGLEKAPFFKDMMSHLRNQFRQDGQWLDKKIETRKRERSEEVQSKEAKRSPQSNKEAVPAQKGAKKASLKKQKQADEPPHSEQIE